MTRRSIYGKTWLRAVNGNAAVSHRSTTRAANIVVPELMSSLTALEPPQPLRATQKGIKDWEYLHLPGRSLRGNLRKANILAALAEIERWR